MEGGGERMLKEQRYVIKARGEGDGAESVDGNGFRMAANAMHHQCISYQVSIFSNI